MSVRIDETLQYYDLPIEEEELSQTQIHQLVIRTLLSIIEQMYQNHDVTILTSVNIYYPNQPAVAPDVTVIDKKIRVRKESGSYYVTDTNPAPRVAIEIASNQTWERDLKDKLTRYEKMGTLEYFVFDPNVPQVWKKEWRKQGRIVGWRLNQNNKLERIPVIQQGRIWSNQLDSWLVIEPLDEVFGLRLYEQDGITQRPTMGEVVAAEKRRADAAERLIEEEKRQREAMEAELERLRKLLEKPNN